MILQTKQTFDQVMLDRANSSEFLKFVAQHAEQDLVSKLIDELQDHKLHIVKLGESWTENDERWRQVTYRQILENAILVQCKNCRMAFPWCQRFRDEFDGNGFCPYGKEIEEAYEQKALSYGDWLTTDDLLDLLSTDLIPLLKKERNNEQQ